MEFNIRLNLTLSKIMGVFVILAGVYGFCFTESKSESSFLVLTGAGMIGYKQHLTSKKLNNE